MKQPFLQFKRGDRKSETEKCRTIKMHSHPHASASDSTSDFWRYIDIWLTLVENWKLRHQNAGVKNVVLVENAGKAVTWVEKCILSKQNEAYVYVQSRLCLLSTT